MAVRKVIRLGHPTLRDRARELSEDEIRSSKIQKLVRDMVDTMHSYDGIGLAAPQIGESVRVSVIELDLENPRYPEQGKFGLGVYINPQVTVLDPQEQGFWEGCLSVPGMRGLVYRPRKIRVEYLNEKAEPKTIEVEGFLATVFQHEFDHLDGILYVDRIRNEPGKTPFTFNEEYEEFQIPEDDDDIGELPD